MSATALRAGQNTVSTLSDKTGRSEAHIMRTVRVMGGALIGIAVLVVVLNEVFTLDAISNMDENSSFAGIINSLETTGAAALSLIVIGLLVLAANRVMGFFGNGGM